MFFHAHRRLFGALLGALTGLAFMLVSQFINHLLLPGVPLYQPPFGAAANTLLGTLLGALLGAVTAWSAESIRGVLLGSFTGALAVAASLILPGINEPGEASGRVVGIVLLFVPTAALLSLVIFAFRWAVDREDEAYAESRRYYPPNRLARFAVPVLVVIAAGLLGLTAMYNNLARTVTLSMRDLIESARQAETVDGLPEPLQAANVHSILENAGQPYTLQWDRDERNRFAIGRPNTNPYDMSTVIARFENGYLLACLFPHPTDYEPRCKDFLPGRAP